MAYSELSCLQSQGVADLRREFIHIKLLQLTGRSPLSFMHTKVVGMLSTKLSLLLLISVHCINPE